RASAAPAGVEEGPIAGPATGAPQRGRGGRGGAHVLSILVPPGRYTVRMRVGGAEFKQPLVVLRDPDSGASAAEMASQARLLVDIATNIDAAGTLYQNIDDIRGQLATTMTRIGADDALSAVRLSVDSVEKRFAFLADSLT